MKYRYDEAPRRSRVKLLFKLLLLVLAVGYIVIVSIWWVEGNDSYDAQTKEHCKQYSVIPESQVDRVPDGCLSTYYENR